MSKHTETIVSPTKLYYGDKEFTIGSLGLESASALALYRVVKFKRPDGVLNGLSFAEMMSIRTIGIAKARNIAAALCKIGIEVKDIPAIAEKPEVELVPNKGGWGVKCTACRGEFYDSMDRPKYRYCPLCGKKLTGKGGVIFYVV